MALKKRAPRKTKPVETEVTFEQPVATVEEKKLPPWKDLAPKQKELMRLCREKTGSQKYIGVFGTRWSSKTIGSMNCIADHMWRTKNAAVLILVSTQGSGSTEGVWNLLTETILPSWFEHDICNDSEGEPMRMKWAPRGEPRPTIAKKLVCSVTNMHGGISKLSLDSLDNEKDVELKYKSRYYTFVYISEAGEFKLGITLSTMIAALRGAGRSPDDFVLLADANPPDEGQDHFLYKFFHELRLSSEVSESEKAIQKCIFETVWTMDDNPYMSNEEKASKRGLYLGDPELYARYIGGLWVRAIRDALFADVFRIAMHVIGSTKDPEPLLLLPSEHCSELVTSHDAGGVNPVSYIMEQITFHQEFKDINGVTKHRNISCFNYLDELAFIGQEIQVSEFTMLMLEKMEQWEKEIGRPITWWHYADRSALDVKESIVQRSVSDEMFAVSNGRIRLIGVPKGSGSVGLRLRLWRRLLVENRVLISGIKCPKLIEMNQCIKRGRAEGTIALHSPHKHSADAATYSLVRLCWDELQNDVRQVRAATREESSLVSVGL